MRLTLMSHNEVIVLNLYCDEIKECPFKIPYLNINEKWTYIGILIVPKLISERFYRDLINLRCLSQPPNPWDSCLNKCKYHDLNNTEIHYQNTDDTTKYKIASKWIDYWINDKENVYFYILGINLSKLDWERFGQRGQYDKHTNMYNRFFRTALKSALKTYFYSYDKIIIENIFHDKSEGENHPYFPWHSIKKIDSEENKIYFSEKDIVFISSDHREPIGDPIHSQFIQFIDLILGCFVNSLHFNSKNKNKYSLADQAYPLISRIIRKPDNPNSKYKYYRRQMLQFFPKENLKGMNEQSLEYKIKWLSQFYHERKLLIENEITGQTSLFDNL